MICPCSFHCKLDCYWRRIKSQMPDWVHRLHLCTMTSYLCLLWQVCWYGRTPTCNLSHKISSSELSDAMVGQCDSFIVSVRMRLWGTKHSELAVVWYKVWKDLLLKWWKWREVSILSTLQPGKLSRQLFCLHRPSLHFKRLLPYQTCWLLAWIKNHTTMIF